MARLPAVFALAWLVGLVAGCGATDPATPGVLSIAVEWVEPAPDKPRSIGGYANFGIITNAAGEQLWSGEILGMRDLDQPRLPTELIELPAGTHALAVAVRAASDAIMVDQNGNVHRDFGPISATCDADIEIAAGESLAVVLTVVGGEACSLSLAE